MADDICEKKNHLSENRNGDNVWHIHKVMKPNRTERKIHTNKELS